MVFSHGFSHLSGSNFHPITSRCKREKVDQETHHHTPALPATFLHSIKQQKRHYPRALLLRKNRKLEVDRYWVESSRINLNSARKNAEFFVFYARNVLFWNISGGLLFCILAFPHSSSPIPSLEN